MPDITRRSVLCLIGAAAAVAVAPALTPIEPQAALIEVLPAWAVGTPGKWDWEAVVGLTEDDAIRNWVEGEIGLHQCEFVEDRKAPNPRCTCEYCSHFDGREATRYPEWDGKDVTPSIWFKSGLGSYCERCGYETFNDGCGYIVGEKILCSDCMTIEDWRIVDPEHAAELEAENDLDEADDCERVRAL